MKRTLILNWFYGIGLAGATFLSAPAQADTPAFVLGSVLTNQPWSFTGTRGWQFGHGGPGSTTSDILTRNVHGQAAT